VATAFLYASQYKGDFRVMNVGSGVGLSVNRVIKDIEVTLGNTAIARRYVPGRVGDVPRNVLDIALIARETGWRPEISWTEGLLETASWMREQLANDVYRSLQPRSNLSIVKSTPAPLLAHL
jgi:UDP-glucose 4-epimerase